ncbi:MAG: cysteine--tRNA ligase, partial [Firmicutes bacterium]|nr:cysteine--tRNA ligase [Bacillota bacterium]
YRSPLDFDDEKLTAAGRGLERIKTSLRLLNEALEKETSEESPPVAGDLNAAIEPLRASFEAAMDDDFNTALAISVIFDLAREVNTVVQRLGAVVSRGDRDALENALRLYQAFNEVTGIFKVDENSGKILIEGSAGNESALAEGLLNLIIEVRQEARKKKDWGTADRIRDGLKELGIILEDTPQGVRWKKQG